MTKKVYSYDRDGYYNGEAIAHESPLEKDVYLMPANTTDVEPPVCDKNQLCKWTGKNWIQEDQQEEESETKPTEEELLKQAKEDRCNEAEMLRKNQQLQPILYQESQFSTSQMARQNILSFIATLKDTPDVKCYWRDDSDNAYQFNLSDFSEILKIILLRDGKLYFVETEIRKIIKRSSDLDSLRSLNLEALWHKQEKKYEKSQQQF